LKNVTEKLVALVARSPTSAKERIESKKIIVVDDCSHNGTQSVLKDKVSRMVDRIIYYSVNRGKRAPLRSGFAAATGKIILARNADLE
jgi:glycosyltransferase involved in cell wall biosynthesis